MTALRARAMQAALVALLAIDLWLILVALRRAGEEFRDGAGYVTTGGNVAGSIAAVLLLAGATIFTRLPAKLRFEIQVSSLAAIALHAGGHLFGYYAAYWWYDEVLHVVFPGIASVLLVRTAQALDLFPTKESTGVRAAILTIVVALAVAAAWEIFEFLMDAFQRTREQDNLVDTMRDMIAGGFGGAMAAAWAAWYPRPDDPAASAQGDRAKGKAPPAVR